MALSTNLVNYYKLDETSGTLADDALEDSDGTHSTSAVTNQTGIIDKAVVYTTGTSNHTTMGGNEINVVGAISISCWIKKASGQQSWIISKIAGAEIVQYVLGVEPNDKAIFKIGSNTGDVTVTSDTALSTTAWNHVVCTWDGSTTADKIIIYLDGSSDGTGTFSGTQETTTNACEFGQNSIAGGKNVTTFYLDEVGVWDRAITSAEASALYNSGDGLPYADLGIIKQVCTDVLTIVDSAPIKSINKVITDVITIEDGDVKNTNKTFDESILLVEDLSSQSNFKRTLTDVVTLAEAVSKSTSRFLEDPITFVDSVTSKKIIIQSLTDVITINEVITTPKITAKNLTDVLVLNEVLNKNMKLSLTDVFSIIDADTKKATKLLVDVLTLVDSLTKKHDATVSLTDELTFVDSVTASRMIDLELNDMLTLTDALNKKIGINKIDVLTFIESIGRGYHFTFDDSLTLADSVTYLYTEFVGDMQRDFQTILADVPFAEDVGWSRPTKIEDEMGREASRSSWTKEITMLIQPISEKDRNVLGPGIEVTSHMKAYVQWGFKVDNGFASVKTGDYIERKDGDLYIVEKVLGKHNAGGLEIFRKLILRAIDNDGV